MKFICFITIIFWTFSIVAIAETYIRPQNPTIDFVPQNVGIYDTFYCNFKESDCRYCHGTSVAVRMHGTAYALSGQCLFCHNGPPSVRDCKVCHIDGGIIGDYGNPHHNTDYSDSGFCTACHDPALVSDVNTVEPPTYDPSDITPTPYSCENCHWPSNNAPHEAVGEYLDGDAGKFLTDWQKWDANAGSPPIPTTWPDSLPHPAVIEANGPVFSGVLWPGGLNTQRPTPWTMAAKPYRPQDGTHHEINGNVYSKCYDCHGTNPETDPSWNPNDPYLIRMCENCHDIGTLHGIDEHVTTQGGGLLGGYAGNSTPDQTITANQKCVACHGDDLGPLPPAPAVAPTIWYLEPWFGSPGMVVTLYPETTGPNGIPEGGYPNGDDRPDFGTKNENATDEDAVQMNQGTGWINVPILSWAENKIEFVVPGWVFTLDAAAVVRVHKVDPAGIAGPVNSNTLTFFVRAHPEINSITPPAGPVGTIPTIAGSGFFTFQETFLAAAPCGTCPPVNKTYGYSSYVEMVASNDRYRPTQYAAWTATSFMARIITAPVATAMLDMFAGNQVLPPDNTATKVARNDLYEGDWSVVVVTDYFLDDGDGQYRDPDGTLDLDFAYVGYEWPVQYNPINELDGPNGTFSPAADMTPYKSPTTSGDVLLYREISDPIVYTVNDNPYLHTTSPRQNIPINSTFVILGANFGVEQGNNYVRACNPPATTCVNLACKWSNTKIGCRMPNVPGVPRNAFVQVVVPDGIAEPVVPADPRRPDQDYSNVYGIVITP